MDSTELPTRRPRRKPTAEGESTAQSGSDAGTAPPPRQRRTRKAAVAQPVSSLERHHLIEVAAYFIAERNGFQPGSAHDYWLQAEREIDALIAAGRFAG